MMTRSLTRIAILAAALFAVASVTTQAANRKITKVAGDVYRFQNNFHYSLVTVTNDGVVVVDPA